MSGIVGIVNFDGAPIDQHLLQEMVDSLAFRGPDKTSIWIDGSVGFGHTLLALSPEYEREQHPCSLDGIVWIVADARIDDRSRLKRELALAGRNAVDDATDVELILHAYHVWGEDCVQHLLGDFSFAIWDSSRQRLFCARDHFGIRLFYYARIGNCFIFSNTISAIRLHPLVSKNLNDLAIADFLLIGSSTDLNTTSFADIQRFPPGHSLSVTKDALQKKQYFQLTIDKQIRYKRDEEYVEHFLELLDIAVGDRVRMPYIAILMSGGLDSPTLAASAKRLLSKQYSEYDLRAYTVVYDRLIPDDERYYAGLAAEKIGISIKFYAADEVKLKLEPTGKFIAEPFHYVLLDNSQLNMADISQHSKTVLYGEDPDALLHPAIMPELLKTQGFLLTALDLAKSIFQHRQVPHFGTGIYGNLLRIFSAPNTSPDNYPVWLNPDFESRYRLRERWHELKQARPTPDKTMRPMAYQYLSNPYWQTFLERNDPGLSGFPLQIVLPYMDIRLANFMLALPSWPWGIRKYLLRKAGIGILPDELLLRRKTALQADILSALLGDNEIVQINRFVPSPKLDSYINRDAIPSVGKNLNNTLSPWINMQPYCLNTWLQLIG